ncbi:MAG: transketolase [Smithellaceae bacterium]|nr:transketolase [Smithellaceae bacterium]
MSDQDVIVQNSVNTIRFLAADTIEGAKSGHPGMPLGAAAMAYTLWMKHLKHNPADPSWPDRDRFVLSAGHASSLLYALLHLTGYDLSLDDLKSFRQWGSKTPGHPERDLEVGIEMTTGPLGQGISTAVGMAMAETHLAARFNRPGQDIVNHFTYVLASEGDIMEGVSYEACSLAGHLGLGKLIVLCDENGVTLAGGAKLSYTEDTARRFEACGWHVQRVTEGNSTAQIDDALVKAKAETGRPSIIIVCTVIGCGSPGKQGSCEAHGSPLGTEELRATKEALGWPTDKTFFVPDEVSSHFLESRTKGKAVQRGWEETFAGYEKSFPDLAASFRNTLAGELPGGWESSLAYYPEGTKDIATRKASEAVLQSLASAVPQLMGGSADLNPSTFTWLKGQGDYQNPTCQGGIQGAVGGSWGYEGRNIHFGIREHAMGAIAGGMALHGGIIPYTATFLTFADYMRPPIRLAALMGLRVIYIFTHDSIGVGEDGPTHQPIEQVMNLRAVPNLTVIRPADANETIAAWKQALANRKGPTVLVFTRQNLPVMAGGDLMPASNLENGGYVLWDSSSIKPNVILMATGSEVSITLEAARKLAVAGIRVRVVSLPSW